MKLPLVTGMTVAVVFVSIVSAQPLPYKVDVMCGATKMGEFVITSYEVSGPGVEIEGCWNPLLTFPSTTEFRFLQIVHMIDSMPLKYPDCSGTPQVPFTDTPKGGYCNQPFDEYPWYNQWPDSSFTCPFPRYFGDSPTVKDGSMSLMASEVLSGYKANNRVRFETWLVFYRPDNSTILRGLAHIRWGYDRQGGNVTKIPLDAVSQLSVQQINTALEHGLFTNPRWTFTTPSKDVCADASEYIPTLSEWALIVFSVLLLAMMTYYIIRRRRLARSTVA